MKSLTIARALRVGGKRCEVTVHEEASGAWHWLMAIPGLLVLSGSAPTESAAIQCAQSTADALTPLLI